MIQIPFLEVKKEIENYGVTVLTTEDDYFNKSTFIKVKCSKGCIVHVSPGSCINKSTNLFVCPNCSSYKTERAIRYCFKCIFNEEFNKIRPDFLKSKRSYLELDGFSKKLNIAWEFNGKQHYELCLGIFHKSQKDLFDCIERDKIKIEKCKNNGIKLIIIKYNEITKFADIKNVIKEKCTELNIDLPDNFEKIEIDFSKMPQHDDAFILNFLEKCKELHIESQMSFWEGAKTKIPCHCLKCNFNWSPIPDNITNNGHSCPKCANTIREMSDFHNWADKNNLLLNSTEYLGTFKKMSWTCKTCKDTFDRDWNNIRRYQYKCKICLKNNKNKLNLGKQIQSVSALKNILEILKYKNIIMLPPNWVSSSKKKNLVCLNCYYCWIGSARQIRTSSCRNCKVPRKHLKRQFQEMSIFFTPV